MRIICCLFLFLMNAHGYVPNCPLLDVEVEEWDRTFDVNVKGTMLMCQAVGRRWVRDGIRGAIVNLSSGASLSARPGGAHYCGSKAAVNLLTEVLAAELGPHGIRVNAVAPGLVMDEVLTAEAPDQHEYVNLMLRHAAGPYRVAAGYRRGDRLPGQRAVLMDHRGRR